MSAKEKKDTLIYKDSSEWQQFQHQDDSMLDLSIFRFDL